MAEENLTALGLDLSTTAFKLAVRRQSQEDYVSIPIRGATTWLGEPAFFLEYLPEMFLEALDELESRGWKFDGPCAFSLSCRQHDLTVLGRYCETLLPALSWQCNAATAQVKALQEAGADRVVGPIEPRFILPKLMWMLESSAALRDEVRHVLTTGDFIAARLTGQYRLSTSDAVSNALLDGSKQLAADVLQKAGIPPAWFPEVVASGGLVGYVAPPEAGSGLWGRVRERLPRTAVYAGLGDNHASALGTGLTGHETVVISAGSSGTVMRLARPEARLAGKAVQFEYFDDRLLLMMLHRCTLWYNEFLRSLGREEQHQENNELVQKADVGKIVFAADEQSYPAGFDSLPLDVKLASVQFSIAARLLQILQQLLREVEGQPPINRVVLTGGLAQSEFFRAAMHAGVKHLLPEARLERSARSGALSSQTAAFGAIITATMAGDRQKLPEIVARLCETTSYEPADASRQEALKKKLGEVLAAG